MLFSARKRPMGQTYFKTQMTIFKYSVFSCWATRDPARGFDRQIQQCSVLSPIFETKEMARHEKRCIWHLSLAFWSVVVLWAFFAPKKAPQSLGSSDKMFALNAGSLQHTIDQSIRTQFERDTIFRGAQCWIVIMLDIDCFEDHKCFFFRREQTKRKRDQVGSGPLITNTKAGVFVNKQ